MASRFKRACALYSSVVRDLYRYHSSMRGYGYVAVPVGPVMLSDMMRAYLRCVHSREPYPVLAGYSEATVFDSAATNHMFRYLHDHEHIDRRMGISTAEEVILGEQWAKRVAWVANDEDVYTIARLDTVGQTMYYAEHGVFPANQREWVREQFEG